MPNDLDQQERDLTAAIERAVEMANTKRVLGHHYPRKLVVLQ